jgi:hypothetical protein
MGMTGSYHPFAEMKQRVKPPSSIAAGDAQAAVVDAEAAAIVDAGTATKNGKATTEDADAPGEDY